MPLQSSTTTNLTVKKPLSSFGSCQDIVVLSTASEDKLQKFSKLESIVTSPGLPRFSHRVIGRILFGLITTLSIGLLSAERSLAEAGYKVVYGSTHCTSQLTNSSGTASLEGKARGYAQVSPTMATLGQAQATVGNYTCGREDRPFAASKLSSTIIYTVTMTDTPECNLGFPSGVSCTVKGKTLVIRASNTCKNKSTCSSTMAPYRVYPPYGGAILQVRMESAFSGQQGRKQRIPSNTEMAFWSVGR